MASATRGSIVRRTASASRTRCAYDGMAAGYDATPWAPDVTRAGRSVSAMMERLYFQQLLAGIDFAVDDPVAAQWVNFVYLIGDRERGEAVIVDPAYAVRELVELLDRDGLRCTGALITHWHPDHCGGDLAGDDVEGIAELLTLEGLEPRIHVQRDEARWVAKWTGVSEADLTAHESGDIVRVGDVDVTLIHTPGHTSGSQCFFVANRLVSGDTLFLEGCGRMDLPGSDPDAMYESLTQKLARVPDDAVLYPGHLYSPGRSATMGHTRANNRVLRIPTLDEWRTRFGAPG